MALSKKAQAIEKWSGGILMIKEVNPDGSDLDSPPDWQELSFIMEAELKDETAIENVKDETGQSVRKISGARDVTISGLFMQSDADLLNFLKETCRDRYYRIYRYEGKVGTRHQEVFFGICEFTPKIELKSGTKRPPFEISVLKNEKQVTIPANNLPGSAKTPDAVIINAGEMYKFIETNA